MTLGVANAHATEDAPAPVAADSPEQVAEQAPVTLEDVVKEMATFNPVWDANVRALRDGVVVGEATSNQLGRFEMRGVEPGPVQIIPRRPGYQDGDLELEVTLRPLTDRDRGVIVVGSRLDLLVRTEVIGAWDPRLAGRFGIVKGGTLKAGTGLYNQPPQGIELGFGDALGFERAWASEIGWEQKIGPALTADVTGF